MSPKTHPKVDEGWEVDGLFTGLAERYGWGPEVVGDLTPAQAMMYLGVKEKQGKRLVKMSLAEAQAFIRRHGKPPGKET